MIKVIIAGVDEAGRGPVIGPMVLTVASIHKNDEEKLLELGVDDSKVLTPVKRKQLFVKLKSLLLEQNSFELTAKEIDSLRLRHSLNEIEAMKIALILNELKQKPDIVFVDSPDVVQENFSLRIKKYLNFKTIIKSEHKADSKYVIVSSASIIAKVLRDNKIFELSKVYGEIGSGYPADEKTIAFIRKWLKTHSKLPEIVRMSWDTTKNLLNEKYQKKLTEYDVK
ncbi:MAG: ribonuclease HII [archaeon]